MSFPFKVRFWEKPTTEWHDSTNNIRVQLMAHTLAVDHGYGSKLSFAELCYVMIKSTWADEPVDVSTVSEEELQQVVKDLFTGKVLPNSMERMQFTFLIEGLTIIEVTHMLRHRTASSVHAQCTADRFLHHDSCFVPSSIVGSKWEERYKKLTQECKELYADMVRGSEDVNEVDEEHMVSILDARYILTRNHRYFYYFTFNIKDLIGFLHQRKCTQVQPELDNIIAHQMVAEIANVFPEILDYVNMKCDERCFYVKAPDGDNSRLYAPDATHRAALEKTGRLQSFKTLYNKTRQQMGVWFNPQD